MTSKTKVLIGMFILSTALILLGILARVQQWDQFKSLMPLGIVLQTIAVGYALFIVFLKKEKQ